jgi:hypothetical protein
LRAPLSERYASLSHSADCRSFKYADISSSVLKLQPIIAISRCFFLVEALMCFWNSSLAKSCCSCHSSKCQLPTQPQTHMCLITRPYEIFLPPYCRLPFRPSETILPHLPALFKLRRVVGSIRFLQEGVL